MFTASCLTDLKEVMKLRSEWEALLVQARNKSIFMTWEWLVSWWEIFGGDSDLWWLIIRSRDGKMVGGAPLYLRKHRNGLFLPHRELRFVGTGASVAPEHLDIVVDHANSNGLVRTISAYLVDHFSDWDILCLANISDPAAATYQLADELVRCGATSFIESQLPNAPYIPLPNSWDEYFKSLSAKMRANIARHRRKLDREYQVTFHVWSHADGDLDLAFDEFERLFQTRKASVGIGNKFEEVHGYRQFHRLLAQKFAEKDWLYLAFLKNGKKPLAAEYTFKYLNSLYSYQFGFDAKFARNNVFKVLRSYIIEDAIGRGLKEFELLRGQEPYKYAWKAVPMRKHLLKCFSPTFYGRALLGVSNLRRVGRRVARTLRLVSGRV